MSGRRNKAARAVSIDARREQQNFERQIAIALDRAAETRFRKRQRKRHWQAFILAVLCLAVLTLVGCGMADELPDTMHVKTHCDLPGATVDAETKISCADAESNLQLARRMYGAMGLEDKFTDLRIQIWNRQLLYCDQYFLGVCVHFVKGDAYGGSAIQWVNLNNGGELLLHELLHFAETPMDPNHTHWGTNGFKFADWFFRQNARMLTNGPL
jgi:hypothetical protein